MSCNKHTCKMNIENDLDRTDGGNKSRREANEVHRIEGWRPSGSIRRDIDSLSQHYLLALPTKNTALKRARYTPFKLSVIFRPTLWTVFYTLLPCYLFRLSFWLKKPAFNAFARRMKCNHIDRKRLSTISPYTLSRSHNFHNCFTFHNSQIG